MSPRLLDARAHRALVALLIAVGSMLVAIACRKETSAHYLGVPTPPADAWPEDPIAILVAHDPWAQVIGADIPRTEVFSDGTVIVMRAGAEGPELMTGHLSADELHDLRSRLGPTDRFLSLKESYDLAPGLSDLPTVEVVLTANGRRKRVTAYGYLFEQSRVLGTTRVPTDAHADQLPPELDRVCRLLADLAVDHLAKWSPRYVEVMIWPYEYSPEEPVHWPREWPDLENGLSFQHGDLWSIILPGNEQDRLHRLVAGMRQKQAVCVDERKWAITYRPVMPGGRWAKRINDALAVIPSR